MNFLELKDISERHLELVNPTSPEKILTVGRVLGLKEGSRVIDFGSGYGEVLALWAQHFGISGIGIDLREKACKRARAKMAEGGLVMWINENPNHPARREVIEHLHQSQDEYTRYAREYFGWAIYVLNPVHYGA